jgi:hypothetical protein
LRFSDPSGSAEADAGPVADVQPVTAAEEDESKKPTLEFSDQKNEEARQQRDKVGQTRREERLSKVQAANRKHDVCVALGDCERESVVVEPNQEAEPGDQLGREEQETLEVGHARTAPAKAVARRMEELKEVTEAGIQATPPGAAVVAVTGQRWTGGKASKEEIRDARINTVLSVGLGATGVMLKVAREVPAAKRLLPGLKMDGGQFGKKVGKHAADFGLDPADANGRAWIAKRIEGIVGEYDEIKQGPWNAGRGGGSDWLFYRQGADVVITKPDGSFVTILKDGAENLQFMKAKPVY